MCFTAGSVDDGRRMANLPDVALLSSLANWTICEERVYGRRGADVRDDAEIICACGLWLDRILTGISA